jgi:hypothetical protein
MTRLMTLADVGLGGAELKMRFKDREQLVLSVAHLAADGHGHHFAVIDEGHSIMMSRMAIECLQTAGLLPEMEETDA